MKLITMLFLLSTCLLAQTGRGSYTNEHKIQEVDTVFTAKDSIIVEDFEKRIKAFEDYQKQLQKEYEGAETIKNYLINSKAILENKKNGKRK